MLQTFEQLDGVLVHALLVAGLCSLEKEVQVAGDGGIGGIQKREMLFIGNGGLLYAQSGDTHTNT